jgi:hypothetical protein
MLAPGFFALLRSSATALSDQARQPNAQQRQGAGSGDVTAADRKLTLSKGAAILSGVLLAKMSDVSLVVPTVMV